MIPDQITAPAGVGDDRDYLAYPHVSFDVPDTDDFYNGPFALTHLEYIELVWRRRAFTCNFNVNNFAGNNFTGTFDFDNWNTNPPSDEGDLFRVLYDGTATEIHDEVLVPGVGGSLIGGVFNRLYRWNPDSFTPFFQLSATFENPLLSATQIYSFLQTGMFASLVTCTFLGKTVPMFVGNPATDGTGLIEFVAKESGNGFWPWDGHFDPDTGAPI